jgi:hypothetical protein
MNRFATSPRQVQIGCNQPLRLWFSVKKIDPRFKLVKDGSGRLDQFGGSCFSDTYPTVRDREGTDHGLADCLAIESTCAANAS